MCDHSEWFILKHINKVVFLTEFVYFSYDKDITFWGTISKALPPELYELKDWTIMEDRALLYGLSNLGIVKGVAALYGPSAGDNLY